MRTPISPWPKLLALSRRLEDYYQTKIVAFFGDCDALFEPGLLTWVLKT